MATIEREFYWSCRGPSVSDIDTWRLVFDRCSRNLVARHQWKTDRHSGMYDFGIAEFLVEQGATQSALLTLLFDEMTVPAKCTTRWQRDLGWIMGGSYGA
jgi:hypothetical protein